MSVSGKQTRRLSRIHYGWYVLIASFVLLLVNAGPQSIFGLLVKPMQDSFGWSRGAVQSAAFLYLAVYAVSILVTGKMYDRWGPKWVIIGSGLLVTLGFALMATVHSLWQLLFYYGVLAASGAGGTSVPLFASLMGRWFEKRRGLAVSLALAGNSAGQFALIPLLSHAITISGWRSTCLWMAGLALVVDLTLTFGVIRGDPDKLCIRPYGRDDTPGRADAPAAKGVSAATTALPALQEDLTLRQAMRTRSLWLFTMVMLICGAGDFLVLNHLVAMVTDYGVSEATGASMLAWCGLLGLAGLLSAGPAVDRLGNKIPVAVTFTLRTAMFVMLLLHKGTALFWVYALGMGFTLPITAPIVATLVSKLYGVRHIGFISGFVVTIHMLGGGLWSYLGGVLYDRDQNYDVVMLISAIAAALAVLCTVFIREKRHLVPVSSS